MTTESQLSFPCDFSFKVIGSAGPEFEGEVLKIFHQHFPSLGEAAISSKLSRNKRYLALTILVHAKSQAQLDATYTDLSSNPHVLFAL